MASKDFILTQDNLKEFLIYFPETGYFINRIDRSFRALAGQRSGSIAVDGKSKKKYRYICLHYKIYRAGRLAWLYVHGEFPSGVIDHIDGNGLNDKIINLRSTTRQNNQKNQRISTRNGSGTLGVKFKKDLNKWESGITVNREYIYLGLFSNKDEAIAVRLSAQKKYNFHVNHGTVRPL